MGAYELLVIAATQVFVFALAVCTIALCGGKKSPNDAKPIDGQPVASPAYVSKSCNKREGLAMDDPDLKSDKLLVKDAGKKDEVATTQQTTAATAVGQQQAKTAGVAPTQEQTKTNAAGA